jgi:hypothetical protein
MPRYFFHVRGGAFSFDDETGETCSSHEAAEAIASNIARELAGDGETYRGYHVLVTDQNGNEIGRIAIAD